MNEIDELKDMLFKKWTDDNEYKSTKSQIANLDERLSNAYMIFDDWYEKIPDEYKSNIIAIINNIEYFSKIKTNKGLIELNDKLNETNDITTDNVVYAYIKSKDGISNSSNDYWYEYKLQNGINKHLCYERLSSIDDEAWEYIENIVFIDDFSGSGNSFIKELDKCPERYKGKNIFLLVISIMQDAVDTIEHYAKKNNISINVIHIHKNIKALDVEALKENKGDAEIQIREISTKFGISTNYHFGYENTQALVAFHNNTPNNTLGFIWWHNKNYKALFPRNMDVRPSWQNLNKKKKGHNVANYNNKKRSG